VAASLAGVGLAALLAGCASAASTARPATAAGPRTGTQANTAVPAGATAAGAPSTAGAPSCQTAGLKVAKGTLGAAAGSVYLRIDFTNTSGAACTLYGYPGVALTTAMTSASQVGPAATRNPAQPARIVTLAPRASASATLRLVQVANYPAGRCGPVSGSFLQVYPPGQKTAVYLSYQGQTCVKPVFAMGIGAVAPGTSA
jgi:hypothetical protein